MRRMILVHVWPLGWALLLLLGVPSDGGKGGFKRVLSTWWGVTAEYPGYET